MLPHSRFFQANEDFRDPYSRDRDRIIHCSSFRKLEYKTQVFLNLSGDYFRTRLTHSLEVSQISRTLAKNLGLNESLSEAIALAHDLGHTPFGHAGGDALDEIMKESGYHAGFEHNFQSFRVVSKLEKRYKDFEGLNLTFATLEGVLKHSYPYEKSYLSDEIKEIFKIHFHPSLEAIIVDLSDEIAYISHDIDDGIKYKLITFEDLQESAITQEILKYLADKEKISIKDSIFRHRFTSRLITILVYDLQENIQNFHQTSPQCATINAKDKLSIAHTKEMQTKIKILKKILFSKLYRHEEINRKMYLGRKCVKSLYKSFKEDINLLPKDLQEKIQKGAKAHRVCADFIASMSDRYALNLYKELGF